MDTPPSLPRQRISAFVLIALFLLLLALAARELLTDFDQVLTTPFQKLVAVVGGLVAAAGAAFFAMIALILRRRPWILSAFLVAAAICICGLLGGELRKPLAAFGASLKESMADGANLGSRPIPQEKSAATEAQLQPAIVAWGEETMVRPYLERVRPGAGWDESARQLIRGAVLQMALSPASPGWEHLRALGARILRQGCDDPWVVFLIRRMGNEDPDFAEAMGKSASTLAQAGYPPFCVCLARMETVRGLRRDAPSEAAGAMKDCLESLREALAAKPLDAGGYRIWSRLFDLDTGESLLKENGDEVCRVVDSVPGIQEWFRAWLHGHSEITQAWEARGRGWANTVSDEGWRLFSQHLATARAALERAQKSAPSQPAIAMSLMRVELGESHAAELRAQFDRAVQAQFDYLPAYNSLRNALLPRWFGSEEALLAYGRGCLSTNRFDTEVPWQMVRAAYDIAKDQPDLDTYYRGTAAWEDLLKTLDGYLAHGNPARRKFYLSEKAVLGVKRNLPPLVKPILEELDYQIDPEVIAEWNLPVQWAARIATYCTPASSALAIAENEEDTHPEKSVQSLLTAQKLPGLPPVVKVYLERRLAEIQAEIALQAAPWHPLALPQDLSGWKTEGGTWRADGKSEVEVKTENADALLTQLQPIGDTWELKGELVLTGGKSGRAEAAFLCGPAGDLARKGFSLRIWTAASGTEAISLARGFRDDPFSKGMDAAPSTWFFIRFANQRVRVIANKVQWLADQPLPEGIEIGKDALLSLGSTSTGQTVQFRHLEWRTPAKEN